ncbi:MAG: CDP-glycerol glycerophosphotransferase family protein [Chloroflexota bacterium]|nr:CDP-glycerol glycerophosphotransferase family protein [Chloroflexota bacterium]
MDEAGTVEPIGATPPDAVIGVQLLALDWQRFQLVLRLRSNDQGLIASGLRLDRLDTERPIDPMPPTHLDAEDDELLLRFNLMLGPGQRPLASGLWVLTQHGTALTVMNPDAVDPELDRRSFAGRWGRYRISPLVDEVNGALSLQIRRRRPRARRKPPSLRRRVTSWFNAVVRRRIFMMLADIARATKRGRGRHILFTSDSHATLEGNLAVVHDRMVERGLQHEYSLSTVFKSSIAARRSWRDRWRLPRLLARADVIFLDDYQPIIYRFDAGPDVRIIQLWHASGAFKTVGYSRIGKPGGPSPFARRHKNYTHAIVSSEHDVPFYAEAFGIPEERVVPTGIPRMDRFFDESQRAAGRKQAIEAFPSIAGRHTILFAPTFRGSGPRNASYDYQQIDYAALHALCVEKDAVMIMKMHPFVRAPWPIPVAYRDRLIDATRTPIDVNDLLFAVDLLITDYSSIVFEFSTLLRPMLFFAYDLDEYVASRDFYVPFEEFVPGRIARTFAEMLAALREDDFEAHKVAAFARKHFDRRDDNATDRIIDTFVIGR